MPSRIWIYSQRFWVKTARQEPRPPIIVQVHLVRRDCLTRPPKPPNCLQSGDLAIVSEFVRLPQPVSLPPGGGVIVSVNRAANARGHCAQLPCPRLWHAVGGDKNSVGDARFADSAVSAATVTGPRAGFFSVEEAIMTKQKAEWITADGVLLSARCRCSWCRVG